MRKVFGQKRQLIKEKSDKSYIETQEGIERKCKARGLEHITVKGKTRYITPSEKPKLGYFQRYMEKVKEYAEEMSNFMFLFLCLTIYIILGVPFALFAPDLFDFYIYIPIIFIIFCFVSFSISCFIIFFLYIKNKREEYEKNKIGEDRKEKI